MRGLLFLMLMFFGLGSFSQKLDSIQKIEVLNRINILKLDNKYKEVIDSCDKYLIDEECSWFREKLFTNKTQCLYSIGKVSYRFEKRFRGNPDIYLTISDSTLALIDSIIINENIKCGSKLVDFNRMRYEYYGGFDNIKPELNNGNNKIHNEKGFVSVSPQYFYGNNQWVGFEFSLGALKRKTNMKYINSSPMHSFNYFSMGFRKNISTSKGGGINLSLYSGAYKWINVRPINFSYLNNGEKYSCGYAPELGVQFWYLHLNVGYNLAFKKSMRSYEKLYFTVKFDIPFYRL